MSHVQATRTNTELTLRQLTRIVSNESSDEPYLWTFFLKLDGDTARQVGNSFIPAITVQSAPGSHGNVPGDLSIPAALGKLVTTLRPLRVNHLGQTVWVPGQLIAVLVLMEEDANPPTSVVESAHQEVRQFIEDSANEFVSGISISDLVAEASQQGRTVLDIVLARIETLRQTVIDGAVQIVTLKGLDWHTPGALWQVIDADDLIGVAVFNFDERALLTQQPGTVALTTSLEQPDDEFEGRYSLATDVVFSPQTFGSRVAIEAGSERREKDRGRHRFRSSEARLCVREGDVAEWTLFDQQEFESFIFPHPFVQLVFTIGGEDVPLNDDGTFEAGDVTFKAQCLFPFFDPRKPTRPGKKAVTRDVVIGFEPAPHDELPGIRLTNRPADGEFSARFTVHAHVGPRHDANAPRVLMFDHSLYFTGRALESPFYDQYKACMERFAGPSEDYAKSKRVGPRELWGPSQRRRMFEEQMTKIREFSGNTAIRGIDLERIEAELRQRFRV